MKIEEREAKKNYDKSARAYHNWRTIENPQGWFYNEFLEMPATLELLGNVKGKKILDFGCGTGIYSKLLTKKGAKVKGFDISPAMIEIAKEENPKLDLKVGSGYDIPFNEKFDVVLASLVFHYFKDWDKVFKGISKVLKKGGVLVFSTNNPVYDSRKRVKFGKKEISTFGNYFYEGRAYVSWKDDKGEKMEMTFYRKTYQSIIEAILENGFEIIGYKDCFPLKKAKKLFPEDYAEYSKMPFFTSWKVRKK
ncbi:class I SAM-dependent methyltransferase [Candidatus Pacearchaeota archaeon]|nr:class I SAM-dependent methyltransferase [Candidatus Pacearchaeota archaeon]